MTHGTVFDLVSLHNTVCYIKYTMDEFDLGSSSATKIVSEYDQEIPQSQTHGIAKKSHTAITRYQKDKLSKATRASSPSR